MGFMGNFVGLTAYNLKHILLYLTRLVLHIFSTISELEVILIQKQHYFTKY